jgi:SNF2 family DNA or RNA helicase
MELQTLDYNLCRLTPFDHQRIGVETLLRQPFFGIFDEMGAGKTKQCIDAAQFLFLHGIIDKVVVVAPAAIRSVWYHQDPDLGELAKHLWETIPAVVTDYHKKVQSWRWEPTRKWSINKPMHWIITNYEYIRREMNLAALAGNVDSRTMVILDESSAVKNINAQQTKAAFQLRARCGRIVLLNGTPVANNPLDLYAQGKLITNQMWLPDIKTFYHFRARYAIMGGWQGKEVKGWQNIEDLQKRMAPYVLRRLKEDCLDLPAKMPPVALTVPLTPETWKAYTAMRDDMVLWLRENVVSAAPQAITKALRLAQICSGFVGGVEDESEEDEPYLDVTTMQDSRPSFLPMFHHDHVAAIPEPRSLSVERVTQIGREKEIFFLEWLADRYEVDKNFKLLLWCRFLPQVHSLADAIRKRFPNVSLEKLVGGQKPKERDAAKRLLNPNAAPEGPAVLVGTPTTGRMGLNFTAAHYVLRASSDFSHFTRKQSDDRVHRPGQTKPVNYFDIIATGPKGQKTMDHHILRSLVGKDDVATFTTEAWISKLMEE